MWLDSTLKETLQNKEWLLNLKMWSVDVPQQLSIFSLFYILFKIQVLGVTSEEILLLCLEG